MNLCHVGAIGLVLGASTLLTSCGSGAGSSLQNSITPVQKQAAVSNAVVHSQTDDLARLTNAASVLDAADQNGSRAPTAATTNASPSLDFSKERNKNISDDDIRKYIDSRIPETVKQRVFDEMKAQSPALRHNVSYTDGYVSVANTWEAYQAGVASTSVTPLGGAIYKDSNGDENTATDVVAPRDGSVTTRETSGTLSPSSVTPTPKPTNAPCANPSIEGCATGLFRKIESLSGFSAASGYVQTPICSLYSVAKSDTGYLLSGAKSGTDRIDSGIQVNAMSKTSVLYAIYQGVPHVGTVRFACAADGSPTSYLRILTGITSDSSGSFLNLSVAEYNGNGSPTGRKDAIPSFKVSSQFWSSVCSHCVWKRLLAIAQQPPGTNENSGSIFMMTDQVVPTPFNEYRSPQEQFVNWRVGSLPNNFVSTNYLNGGGLTVNPTDLESTFRLLTLNGPNGGTDQPGIIARQCVAPCQQK